MLQRNERFSERLVFYIMPSVRARFENAVGASGMQQADWLRHWLEDVLVRVESEALVAGDVADGEESGMPLASQLVAAQARVQGLEEIVAILRERLGMADAHNLELNKRLEESHSTVDRVMLALPAAGQGSEPTRRSWQFWRR